MSSSAADSVITTDLSIIGLIGNADMVVKLAILMLILSSLWSWSLIFDKLITFKKINLSTDKFEKIFWSGQILEQLYERIKARADHPMAAVFVAAMSELKRQEMKGYSGSNSHHLSVGIKERIGQAMEVARSREMDKIERNLSLLGTIGSAAPFIGLFGTVWGIMHSFQSIAAAKNATLSVVAPGIAEALLATAIGLVAAIPAVIFYNIFAAKLNRLNIRIDDFASELGSLISRELDHGER